MELLPCFPMPLSSQRIIFGAQSIKALGLLSVRSLTWYLILPKLLMMFSFASLGCQENGSQESPSSRSCGIATSMRRLPVRFKVLEKRIQNLAHRGQFPKMSYITKSTKNVSCKL